MVLARTIEDITSVAFRLRLNDFRAFASWRLCVRDSTPEPISVQMAFPPMAACLAATMLKLKIDQREVELSAVGTILKSMANNAKGSVVRATR